MHQDCTLVKSCEWFAVPLIRSGQIRAARALLGWTQDELAARSGVAKRSIANIELDYRALRTDTLERLVLALAENGIVFLNDGSDAGVVLRGSGPSAR